MTNPSNPNSNITGNANIGNTLAYMERAQQHGFDPSKMAKGGNLEQQFFGTLSQSQMRGMLSGMSSEAASARKMMSMYEEASKKGADTIEKRMYEQAEKQLKEIEDINRDLLAGIESVMKNALTGNTATDKDKNHLISQFNSVTDFNNAIKDGASSAIESKLLDKVKSLEDKLVDIRSQKKIDPKSKPDIDGLRQVQNDAKDLFAEIDANPDLSDQEKRNLKSRAAAQSGGAQTLIQQFNPSLTDGFSEKMGSFRAQSRLEAAKKDSGRDTDRAGLEGWRDELKKMRDEIFDASEGNGNGHISDDLKGEEFLKSQGDAANQVNNLIKYIEATLKDSNKKQESSLGVISSLLSTIGAAAFLNKVVMGDPYTYGKRMGISTIGQMGGINGALSTAMGAQADHDQALNQQMFGVGVGIAGASVAGGGLINTLARGRIPGGRWGLAAAGTIIGGGLAAAGANGMGADMYNTIYGKLQGESKNQIFEKTLAQQFINPERLASSAMVNQTAAMAYGLSNIKDKRASQLGNYLDDNAKGSYTGNLVLNKLANYRMGGLAIKDTMNVSNEQYAQNISTAGSMLNANGDKLKGLTGFSMMTGAARGVNAEQVMSMLSSAQGFGSNNMRGQVQGAFAAVSDKNGEVNTYAASVIAPAIMRVAESLTIKNIASNGDKLSTSVQKLFFSLTNTKDSAFNKIMSSHPELMQQTLEGVDGALKGASQDPNKANFLYRHGFTYRDLKQGIGGTSDDVSKTLGKLAQAFVTDFNINKGSFDKDGKLSNNNFVAASQYADMFNIDPIMYEKFLKTYMENGQNMNNPEVQKEWKAIQDKANKNAESNLKKLSADDLNITAREFGNSNRAMITTMQQFNGSVQTLQKRLQSYISSNEFSESARNGISRLVTTIEALIKGTAVPTPPKAEDQGTDPNQNTGGVVPGVAGKTTTDTGLGGALSPKPGSEFGTIGEFVASNVFGQKNDPEISKKKAEKALGFFQNNSFYKKLIDPKQKMTPEQYQANFTRLNVLQNLGGYGFTTWMDEIYKNNNGNPDAIRKELSQLVPALQNGLEVYKTSGPKVAVVNNNTLGTEVRSGGYKGFDLKAQRKIISKGLEAWNASGNLENNLTQFGTNFKTPEAAKTATDSVRKAYSNEDINLKNELISLNKLIEAEKDKDKKVVLEKRRTILQGIVGQTNVPDNMKRAQWEAAKQLGGGNPTVNWINSKTRNAGPWGNVKEPKGFWQGGMTDGMEHEVAGQVHGREFVIGARNVSGNEGILRAINSGEKVDGKSGRGSNISTGNGSDTTLILTLSGISEEDIVRTVQRSIEGYVHANKLHYK